MGQHIPIRKSGNSHIIIGDKFIGDKFKGKKTYKRSL